MVVINIGEGATAWVLKRADKVVNLS
jgi:hypothetical protein